MTRSLNVLNLLGLEATPAAMVSKMVSSLEQSYGKTYPWALSRIVLRLRPGQKEEELHGWTTDHILCRFSVLASAQQSCPDNFPTHSRLDALITS